MVKRILPCVLCLLMLFGCSKGVTATDIQNYYKQMESYTATYLATVDFGGLVSFGCEYVKNGETATVTILSPEEIAGITAVTSDTTDTLVYQDVELLTFLPSQGFTPQNALHKLLKSLAEDSPEEITTADTIKLTYKYGDNQCLVLLNSDSYDIISAEYFSKGDMILSLVLQ